ncbi:tetratricopeptide repeat protein [Neorhodopirellula pilleata]|nr:tetratricopeptide repeat protein [Neorhodopirellula pilleata]
MIRSYRVIVLVAFLIGWVVVDAAHADESAEHQARHESAIQAARESLENQTLDTPDAIVRLGDALLRGGNCDQAVTQFERAIDMRPELEPYLWQHGIALFFVGRFDDAKALFEKHRIVNPRDVENAAWHFLCVAKANDVATARKIVLPAPGDTRVPMKEILQRLSGGDFDAINSAVKKTQGTSGYVNASLYGDLYIGLIADAENDLAIAEKHLSRAAQCPLTHYMADIARVYAARLKTRTVNERQGE